MVKEMVGGIRSAYPLADQPIGTSVPFMPQARPWNVRSASQRPLDERDDGESYVSESTHPAALKPVLLPVSRKTASVTENQGFVENAISIRDEANLRKAGRPWKGASIFKGSHVRDDVLQDLNEARKGPRPPKDEDNLTKPAILWLLLGTFVFPLLLLCGVRYLRSMNIIARRVGYLSLFILVAYILAGLVIFVQFYTSMYQSGWSGSDPICIRYMQGAGSNFLRNELGSAFSIYGVSALGLGPVTNISLYERNCGFVMQVPVPSPVNAPFQTMYVRVMTPGTSGDNFGAYGRNRQQGQINRFSDDAPALAWFQEANPYISNPWPSNSGQRGRPPCLQNMCDGIYQKSSPEINGIEYQIQILLGKFDYHMVVGVFALSSGALERAFCVDTCAVEHVKSAAGIWSNPCAGIDLKVCPQAKTCILAKTRADCLGITT